MTAMKPALLISVLFAFAAGCVQRPASPSAQQEPEAYPRQLGLMSSGFINGQPIPEQFTRDGQNRSPALAWTNQPVATQELALIVTDPDAPKGEFVHWVVCKIPATYRYLAPGLPQQAELPSGVLQGRNDFGKTGYDGPAAPQGDKPHRYVFRLYALDKPLDLKSGTSAEQLRKAMEGHVLDVGELAGTRQR